MHNRRVETERGGLGEDGISHSIHSCGCLARLCAWEGGQLRAPPDQTLGCNPDCHILNPTSSTHPSLLQFQIERARQIFADAEAGVNLLDKDARWPVW